MNSTRDNAGSQIIRVQVKILNQNTGYLFLKALTAKAMELIAFHKVETKVAFQFAATGIVK